VPTYAQSLIDDFSTDVKAIVGILGDIQRRAAA
jgi:hypothetical protein